MRVPLNPQLTYVIQLGPRKRNHCSGRNCPRRYPEMIERNEPSVRVNGAGILRFTIWKHWECFDFGELQDAPEQNYNVDTSQIAQMGQMLNDYPDIFIEGDTDLGPAVARARELATQQHQ